MVSAAANFAEPFERFGSFRKPPSPNRLPLEILTDLLRDWGTRVLPQSLIMSSRDSFCAGSRVSKFFSTCFIVGNRRLFTLSADKSGDQGANSGSQKRSIKYDSRKHCHIMS